MGTYWINIEARAIVVCSKEGGTISALFLCNVLAAVKGALVWQEKEEA
jgi:hypothetical protein